jgi:hypothetical protein
LVLVASAAPPIVAMICTAPKGMLSRIVLKLSKPKEFTIRGPKVVIPPLGILSSHVSVMIEEGENIGLTRLRRSRRTKTKS